MKPSLISIVLLPLLACASAVNPIATPSAEEASETSATAGSSTENVPHCESLLKPHMLTAGQSFAITTDGEYEICTDKCSIVGKHYQDDPPCIGWKTASGPVLMDLKKVGNDSEDLEDLEVRIVTANSSTLLESLALGGTQGITFSTVLDEKGQLVIRTYDEGSGQNCGSKSAYLVAWDDLGKNISVIKDAEVDQCSDDKLPEWATVDVVL